MKAQELRIGNWHRRYYDSANKKYRDEELDLDGMMDLVGGASDEFEGIPLTEEWMIKLGGKNMGGWIGLEFSLKVWDEENECTFELIEGVLTLFVDDVRVKVNKTPYVHQLQNLYFALTGQELEIK